MFAKFAALLSSRAPQPAKSSTAKTSLADRLRAHFISQGFTEDESNRLMVACDLIEKGLRYEQGYVFADDAPTVPASWNILVGKPCVVPSWSELFHDIGESCSRRSPLKTVTEVRAELRAKGCTETEASEVLIKRTLAGIAMLRENGCTLERLAEIPASYFLKVPTHPEAVARYENYWHRPPHAAGRLLWALTLRTHKIA